MTATALRLLAIGASFLAISSTALAGRVKWRVAGTVDSVGPNAAELPFAVKVGQAFIIDMEFEDDSPAVAGGLPGSTSAAYHNIFKATVFVGGSEISITPREYGSTGVWNEYSGVLPFRDRYTMGLTDAATEWNVVWGLEAPWSVPAPGPLDSVALLKTPPDPAAFPVRTMRFTQDRDSGGSPSISAILESITDVPLNSSPGTSGGQNPGADANGGGGRVDAILLAVFGMFALLRRALPRSPGRVPAR